MPQAASQGMAGLLQDAGVGMAAPAAPKGAAPAAPATPKGMAGLLATAKANTAAPATPKIAQPLFGPNSKASDFVKTNFADVGKALTTPTQSKGFFQSLGDSFNSAVDDFDKNVDEWGQSGVLHKADALGKTMLLPVNLLFSPITAALQSTQGIPVIGQLADGLNRLFGAIGAGGGDAANVALNALPISQESKDAIRPITKQLGSLAAQLATGKAGAKVLDVARGGTAEAPVEGAPAEAPSVPEAARTEVVSTAKELGKQLITAMNDPKTHEVLAQRHDAMGTEVKPSEGLFTKSAALPEVKGKLNTVKATAMHPTLRGEIRDAVQTHGPAATHSALMDELGAGHRQAESLIREAPTPQTAAEELQAHQDALRSAVGEDGLTPDKMGTIPFGPKAKPSIDTIDAVTGKVTKAKPAGKGPLTIEPIKEAPTAPAPKTLADRISEETEKNGGSTYDLSGKSPKDGFAYAPSKGTEYSVPSEDFHSNPETHINSFIDKNYDMLSQPGNHIGSWESNGKVYLDVSRVGKPTAATLEEAQKANQLAVFDLGSKREIPTGQITDGVYSKVDEAANILNKHRGEVQGADQKGGSGGSQEAQVSSDKSSPNGSDAGLKVEPGMSRVGKSIEAKAIEANLTKGFDKTAGYDVKSFKNAAEKTSALFDTGIDNVRAVMRGDKPRPEGVTTGSLLAGIEEYAKQNPKEAPGLMSELANSKLTSETSEHAQETGSLRMREPDSATARLQELKKSLVEAAGGAKKVAAAKSSIIKGARAAMKAVNLSKEEISWDKFLDTITC